MAGGGIELVAKSVEVEPEKVGVAEAASPFGFGESLVVVAPLGARWEIGMAELGLSKVSERSLSGMRDGSSARISLRGASASCSPSSRASCSGCVAAETLNSGAASREASWVLVAALRPLRLDFSPGSFELLRARSLR